MKIISEFTKKVEDRIAQCNICEHKTTTLGVDTCGLCGCVIKAKTLMPLTSCPDEPKRWE